MTGEKDQGQPCSTVLRRQATQAQHILTGLLGPLLGGDTGRGQASPGRLLCINNQRGGRWLGPQGREVAELMNQVQT